MPGDERRDAGASGDLPRTDLEPKRLPYDDDYFGTGEEEGVVKEREATEAEQGEAPKREGPAAMPER